MYSIRSVVEEFKVALHKCPFVLHYIPLHIMEVLQLMFICCLQLIDANPDAWIAARFVGPMQSSFLLGDGSSPGNGRFYNQPLIPGQLYRVFVRAYTADNVS